MPTEISGNVTDLTVSMNEREINQRIRVNIKAERSALWSLKGTEAILMKGTQPILSTIVTLHQVIADDTPGTSTDRIANRREE